MTKTPKIFALVPAYNEAENILAVLQVLKISKILNKTLVIDDGSTDSTAQIAQAQGFDVLKMEKNSGKGAAIQAGIKKIPEADIYVFIDADLVGLTTEHIEQLINPLIENEWLSMTVGKFVGGRKRTDWAQALVPNISGQRAMRHGLAHSLPNLDNCGFGVEIVITKHAQNNNFKMQEILLRNITQVMKEEKLGYVKGFKARMKMYNHIVRSYLKRSENIK